MDHVGKRVRFEVLKRDGFRCRYCGANASTTLLHVDHVIPRSKGGIDAPENLVAACATCNAGKSDVRLDESRLQDASDAGAMLEHAEQIRAYMDAVREVEDARSDMFDLVLEHWESSVDPRGMKRDVAASLPYWVGAIGLGKVLQAVDATAGGVRTSSPTRQSRYFIAVMRNMRDEAGGN